MELWKDIPEYEGLYQVSNLGRVKSFKNCRGIRERILKPNKNKNGYLEYKLSTNNKIKSYLGHRLVMLTFKPDEYFEGAHVNHISGIKTGNRLESLEWCTRSENMKHADINGLRNIYGENNPKSKLTEEEVKLIKYEYINTIVKQNVLAKKFNTSISTINRIVNNKYWSNV